MEGVGLTEGILKEMIGVQDEKEQDKKGVKIVFLVERTDCTKALW